MNTHKLPAAWREAGSRLRALAATYPTDHITRACLLNQVGAMELCAQDLEEAIREATNEEVVLGVRKVIGGHVVLRGRRIRTGLEDGTLVVVNDGARVGQGW